VLRRKIEELESKHQGREAKVRDLELEEDQEREVEDGNVTVELMRFLKKKSGAKFEVSCYDGCSKVETLVHWL
jgi:hypothetical protein